MVGSGFLWRDLRNQYTMLLPVSAQHTPPTRITAFVEGNPPALPR